jgi:hypothetical protein
MIPGKKVPEHCSSLHPYEKELPERRSGAFRSQKYPRIHSRVPVKLYVCIYVGVTRYVLVKLSYYTPWRRLEGEEVQQLIHVLGTRWG